MFIPSMAPDVIAWRGMCGSLPHRSDESTKKAAKWFSRPVYDKKPIKSVDYSAAIAVAGITARE
jgi:hypothetical protein